MNHPFQNPDSRSGGTFDALVYFGAVSLGETLKIAETTGHYARLNGPFRDRHLLPSQQEKVTPDFSDDGCPECLDVLMSPCSASHAFVSPTPLAIVLDMCQ